VKTLTISKRNLVFFSLATVAIIGTILIAMDIRHNATKAKADDSEVEAAAAYALSQVLDLDYSEGRQNWEARVKPLCSEHGWAFWNGMFFADQIWPVVIERQYVTENIKVTDARVIGKGPLPDSQIVEVILEIEYITKDDSPTKGSMPNRIVMVRDGNSWLLDTPLERWEETK